MKVSARLHAGVECAREKPAIRVEPSLRFEKAQKQQAGSVQQCELAALGGAAAGECRAEGLDARLEGAIEATGE